MDIANHSLNSTINWSPGEIITGVSVNHVCVILNRKITVPPKLVTKIWQSAILRCTVDGGTNRWRHFLELNCKNILMKLPDLITGDFDSITTESWEYFCDPMIRRIHTPDQNVTDFTKAIQILEVELKSNEKLNNVIVLHETSGRFDQIMANINTLYKMQSSMLNIYLLSGNSITWLLRPGKHSIHIPEILVKKNQWCALLPIGTPARSVTTTGLKWNLTNTDMEFGNLVSTSNTYNSEFVQIETDNNIVWSMGLVNSDNGVNIPI